MPSSTFFNLPGEKQEKLLSAAVGEFTKRSFNQASINRIIQEAGIPRGSFYMYFEDKEDLFRYLLAEQADQLLRITQELLSRDGGDIFQALEDLYEYLQRHRENNSLGDIGVLCAILRCNAGMQKSGLLEMLEPEKILRQICDMVNPDLMDLRSERDLPDMVHMLLSLSMPVIYSGLLTDHSAESYAYFQNMLNILRRGMELPHVASAV